MTTPFDDQNKFMLASGQTVGKINPDQYSMYLLLMAEEYQELDLALKAQDKVEQLDALIDILVVTIGAIHSMGADAEGAWRGGPSGGAGRSRAAPAAADHAGRLRIARRGK